MDENELAVKISGDISELGKALADAQKALAKTVEDMRGSFDDASKKIVRSSEDVGSGLEKITSIALRVGAALGVTFGVEAIVGFTKALFNSAAALDSQAQRVGLSVTGLQTLRATFEEAGQSAEMADMASMRLTRAIGAAASGSTQMASVFAYLKVATLDVNGEVRQTEDILGDLARAILALPSPAQRAQIEFMLFGRTGQAVEPVLKALAEGMANATEKAKELGLVLDPKAADAANKAQVALTQATDRLKVGLTPAATDAANSLADLVNVISYLPTRIKEAFGFAGVPERIGMVKNDIEILKEKLKDIQKGGSGPAWFDSLFAGGRAREAADIVERITAKYKELADLQRQKASTAPSPGDKPPPAAPGEVIDPAAIASASALQIAQSKLVLQAKLADISEGLRQGKIGFDQEAQDSKKAYETEKDAHLAAIQAQLNAIKTEGPQEVAERRKLESEKALTIAQYDNDILNVTRKHDSAMLDLARKAAEDVIAVNEKAATDALANKKADLAEAVKFGQSSLEDEYAGTQAALARKYIADSQASIQKRALAGEDATKLEAINREEQLAYLTYINALEAADRAYDEKARSLALSRAKFQIDVDRSMAQADIAQKQESLNTLIQAGALSAYDELALSNQIATAEYASAVKTEQAKLALADQTVDERNAIMQRLVDAQHKFDLDMQKNANKAALAVRQPWINAIHQIASSFEQGISGMIRGTTSFSQMAGQMFQSLFNAILHGIVTMVEQWIIGLLTKDAVSEASHTKEMGRTAAEAAGHVYDSAAAIPYVGWIIAPIAAAAAFAGVLAFGERGFDVPEDQLMYVHKKEMLLPAPLADTVRNMASWGNTGGGNGGQNHLNVRGPLVAVGGTNASPREIARGLQRALREGDRNLLKLAALVTQ